MRWLPGWRRMMCRLVPGGRPQISRAGAALVPKRAAKLAVSQVEAIISTFGTEHLLRALLGNSRIIHMIRHGLPYIRYIYVSGL